MQFTTIFIAATMAVAASATCTKDCPTTTQVDVSPPAEETNAPTDIYTAETLDDTSLTEEADEHTETPDDNASPVEESNDSDSDESTEKPSTCASSDCPPPAEETSTPDDASPAEENDKDTEASYDASPVEGDDATYVVEALTEPSKNTTAKTTTPSKNSTVDTTTPSKNATTKTTTPSASNKTVTYDDTNILSSASSMTLSGAAILAAAAAFL
ncbi:hypothetical protein BASA50_000744 [Batrachochytrium salamandrivorans]|uniref:Uncharacterized protein n=1 Tax=Batrachochytrium salamandrivorans TaxID=1357716 RepID=A0ABQ8ETG4_9FUNG|nr:hypothetical protein BASA62_008015 [Batrachochytrium salamandrivorans]KAH6586280.1 hypothetical protein BASA50_000744 [Batrachochytrium salamandrivorans]KAH6601538.1 hypothetical protein BASA61_001917 [Batrachochytrium salamandrivorans]KAH9265549.1 hypothetical protein BASA84_001552 [Batrachochytrium salamandrivorans]KAH9275866.1 hypothetical protein BASA83_001671 [Batrachochytrium salamandrivorans]